MWSERVESWIVEVVKSMDLTTNRSGDFHRSEYTGRIQECYHGNHESRTTWGAVKRKTCTCFSSCFDVFLNTSLTVIDLISFMKRMLQFIYQCVKTAVSWAVFVTSVKVTPACFPLSHSAPNLAAGTSFFARCTSCTLEKIFLPGSFPFDSLLFVIAWQSDPLAPCYRWRRVQIYSIFQAFQQRNISVSFPKGFAASSRVTTHTFTKQQRSECNPVQFWLMNYTSADSAKSEPPWLLSGW